MRPSILLVLTLLMACAGRGPGNAGTFERNVGLATAGQLQETARRILTLHQFEIERELDSPSIYIETRWLDRVPFTDERALGIAAAQSRVIIRARPRSGTTMAGETYAVSVKIEQRVRVRDGAEWTYQTLSANAREFADRIAEEMRREFDVGGVRRGT